MRLLPLTVPGAFLVEPTRVEDERGFFARLWDAEAFSAHGLNPRLVHCSISFNRARHTLRGLHYQEPPFGETKLVGCIRGAVFDVIVDLRRDSPTFCRTIDLELSSVNRRFVYIPEGCAHGFQTLEPDSEVIYFISDAYSPAAARGVRWDDPAFDIAWPPAPARIMSDRDRSYPDFVR
jgi:dTDP-4-dehydrorhamnose 3,5-epimerase